MVTGIDKLRELYPWPKKKPYAAKNDHGHMNLNHRSVLAKHIPKDAGYVIEIGTWLGTSARFISDHCDDAHVITIDHFRGSHNSTSKKYPFLGKLRETFIVNTWDYQDRITSIPTNSTSGLELVHKLGIPVDAIYIDGDHREEGFRADLDAVLSYFPEVILIGDDYSRAGVRNVIESQEFSYLTEGQLWIKQ